MKNKLLLTSALASVVALAGSAVAETKVSGNLEFVSNNASATTAAASANGNGFEENIRIDSSKDIALGNKEDKTGKAYKSGNFFKNLNDISKQDKDKRDLKRKFKETGKAETLHSHGSAKRFKMWFN